MTIASETSRVDLVGNGVNDTFTFTFEIYVKTDLLVYVDNVLQEVDVNYTVPDAGIENPDGGTIVFGAEYIPALDAVVSIILNLPYTQLIDYVEADKFPAETHERGLDRLVKIAQQLKERIARQPVLLESSRYHDLTLPDPVAEKYLAWKADLSGLKNISLLEVSGELEVSEFIEDLLDDGDADAVLTTLSLTATKEEINTVADGITATAAEINTGCDGITATAAEINKACDVSGNIRQELTPSPSGDHEYSGVIASMTAGEILAFGELGYIKNDGKVWKSDADAAATMPGLVIALAAIAADAAGDFAFPGSFIRDDTWTWTAGGLIYASGTAGALTQTAPSGAADSVQTVGLATHADRMFFNPQLHTHTVGINCKIKTGTYTGDGTEGQAITGVGFRPKYVRIYAHHVAVVAAEIYEKLDQSWGDASRTHTNIADSEHFVHVNKINSLDADGFTVDDAGTNTAPNQAGIVYDYLALG